MAAESPARSTAMTSVWWDTKSCPVPVGCDPRAVVGNICAGLDTAGYRGPVSFFVFGDVQTTPRPVADALKSSGVVIRHVPAGNKDRCDKKILVEMLIWAFDNPPPANFLLITGDDELSNVLQSLRLRNYDTLLVQPRHTSQSCTSLRYTSKPCNSAQRCMWLWDNLVSGRPASLSDGSAVGFDVRDKSRISMQNENRKRQNDRGGEVRMWNSRKRTKPALNFTRRQNEKEKNQDKDRENLIQDADLKMDQDRHQSKLMREIDFESYQDKHAVERYQDKRAVKLVQEINLKDNGEASMEYEMVQDMDISDEDEAEQNNDVKRKDVGHYAEDDLQQVDEKEQKYEIGLAMKLENDRKLTRSLVKVKGELEKDELKGVNELPEKAGDLNGSLRLENEVSKRELVQNDAAGRVQCCQRNATRNRLRKKGRRAHNLINRQKENETNPDEVRKKLNQEINSRMEQRDESLEKMKGKFEMEDEMIVANEPGQVEGLMKYEMIVANEPGQAQGLMKYENSSLHIEDVVPKTELVQNVSDCMIDLMQSVDGKFYEKQILMVKDELEIMGELEKIEDAMEPKKVPSEIARESQVIDQEDKVAQFHVEQNRDKVQMDNIVKTSGTLQEKKKKKKKRGKVEVVMKMDERTPQRNGATQNFINNHRVIPGCDWIVANAPQCAICGLKHFGICPWANVPCGACGNLGHLPNYCPVNIYRGYLNFFSRRLGFGCL